MKSFSGLAPEGGLIWGLLLFLVLLWLHSIGGYTVIWVMGSLVWLVLRIAIGSGGVTRR